MIHAAIVLLAIAANPSDAPVPKDAVKAAVKVQRAIAAKNPEAAPFQTYIWIPDGNPIAVSLVSVTMNEVVSKSGVILPYYDYGKGKLLRYDFRMLAPKIGEATALKLLWEDLAFTEPYFHSLVERDKKTVVIPADHLGPEINELEHLTDSGCPIVRWDWLLIKLNTTLNGGKYYEFAGIERNPKEGTAQEAFFKSLGSSEQQVRDLKSDQRSAIFRSKVTGKPRRIDVLHGLAVRPDVGTGLITITHDIAEEDVKASQHPIRNLLAFSDRAREVIAERTNGLHIYALFDNAGKLQDVVPDNIAKDHLTPAPHSARLEPSFGCIRCHGTDGSEGMKPFGNDVQKLLEKRLNVFGDLKVKQQPQSEAIDRLFGLYSGDLRKPIGRTRDDYSDAIFRASHGLSATDVAKYMAGLMQVYRYNEVTPKTACLELGRIVKDDEEGIVFLNNVIPDLASDETGTSPEDPILAALKAGININRFEWEKVYSDAMARAAAYKLSQREQRHAN